VNVEEDKEEKLDRPKSTSRVDSSDDESDNGEMEDYDEEETEEIEICAEDEAAFDAFMNGGGGNRTLADVIMEKLREKEEADAAMADATASGEKVQETVERTLDPKVVEVYSGVGKLLSRYHSGKLPKAFKIIPALANWEEVLFLTNPEGWSPHSVCQATRIFASNLNAKMAQRFYGLVLLPRIEADIEENKKLNFHLYQALKKACFKPQAFFKGVVLPMCENRRCTLHVANIVSSVVGKISIPVLHSAVALMKIAEMPYSGANSIFMRTLLDKKYALPLKVVASVVQHFVKYAGDARKLPVFWHQCLLVFVQRYKDDFTPAQREELKGTLRVQVHPTITAEIRRERFSTLSGSSKPSARER
jgi:essential nuclear protein 1